MLFIRKAQVYGALLFGLLLVTYTAEVSSLCTQRSKTYRGQCKSSQQCAMACRSEHRAGGHCSGSSNGLAADGPVDLMGNTMSKFCLCTSMCQSPPPPPPPWRRRRRKYYPPAQR